VHDEGSKGASRTLEWGVVQRKSFIQPRPTPASLDKPGAHLETPQRLGILPTWAFWNRRDVWRYGRRFIAPVAGMTIGAFYALAVVIRHPYWSAPLFGGVASGAIILSTGVLERVVRKRRQLRINDAGRMAAKSHRTLSPDER